MAPGKRTHTHERLRSEGEVRGSSDRGFALVFAVVFAIIALWPVIGGEPPRWWAVLIAAGFAGVGFVKPSLLAPLNRLWLKFGLLLYKVMNPLILGLLFFVTIMPIRLLLFVKIKPATSSGNARW
jgi:predicted membrane metal-binding protein